MSVLVCTCERRPGSPDSIADFGHLLLLESNYLAQVFRAPLVSISTFMLSTSISFLVSELWLLSFFVFPG